MIKRMSFGSLKASFSRRTRRRPRSTISSSCGDGGLVQPVVIANGGSVVVTGKTGMVDENKEVVGDVAGSETSDTKQRTKSKHKGKKTSGRGGIWKTLRHKLSKNHRQCWDAGGSNTELDLESSVDFVGSDGSQARNNKSVKPSSVCPTQSTTRPHPNPPSLHVRPGVRLSSESEGVYDEPTFPNGSLNLPNGGVVNGADNLSVCCSNNGLTGGGGGCSSKTKTKAGGDCCQQAGLKCLDSYANATSGLLKTDAGQSNNGIVDACATSASTPMHDCCNEMMSRQSAFPSMSSFASQISSSLKMLDYRLESSNSTPKIRSLTRELFKLSKYGWYWGPITRTEAEEKLMDQPDGAFLVRDSSDDRHLLSLSFRSYGKTLHTRIEHCNGLFSFYAQPEPEGHTSIVDLIEHSMNYSQSGAFCYSRARSPGSPSFPVRLTKPVSRFTQVRTLQYLCRFIIRQYTRFDHIQELPLPSRIKGYIEEGHY